MAYKTRFQPCEILTGGAWRLLSEPGLTQKAPIEEARFSEAVSTILPAEPPSLTSPLK